MQANLENLSTLERRLSVAVPKAEIDHEIDTRLKHLSRTVKMHGFRPGKVPMKVVAQQYGPQVRQEVLGETLQRTFGEAVRQQNLKVAGYPQFEPKPLDESASDFEYSATFEVYPEVQLGDISGAKISRPRLEVGDAEIDRTVEIMRKQRVTFEAAERAAENADRVTMSYRGTIDGVEFAGGKAENQQVVLGEGRLLADFETQLQGMKAGDSKSFELKFPDDYHGKDVAGKTATFEVSVSEVAAPKLPEVDAEFAQTLGVEDGDIAKMRAEIKGNLEREVKGRLKSRVKDQVMQALLDATKVEVPKSLIESEVERLRELTRQDFAARGIPVRDDMPLPAEHFQQQAQRRVNLGLILAEVVKTNQLQAKPEQVRAIVEEQAQSYENPQEVVRWYYQSPERLREIESMVLEDNVVEWALKTAQIDEQSIDFDELMGNRK
ncbi:MAG: trigger factor [Betaproteobacteria bacterium]|nr:trigger factor [Betaproteobacteria bacterium]